MHKGATRFSAKVTSSPSAQRSFCGPMAASAQQDNSWPIALQQVSESRGVIADPRKGVSRSAGIDQTKTFDI